MKPFLDLVGASGAAYRFRLLAEDEAHVPIAGNYVVVRPRGDGVKIVAVAATNDLSRAAEEQPAEIRRGARIYTRLNVARATREAEHADLAARYATAASDGARAGSPVETAPQLATDVKARSKGAGPEGP